MIANTQETQDRISVTLPLDERYVQVLRLLISGVGARMNFTYDDLEDIKLAVNEAYMLALRQLDAGRSSIEIVLDENELTVYFAGEGFAEPPEDDEVQSWSLFLLEGLMDKVDFLDAENVKTQEKFNWPPTNGSAKCLKLQKVLKRA